MEFADVMADGEAPIDLRHLPSEIVQARSPAGYAEGYQGQVRTQKIETIRRALDGAGGRYPIAAQLLGVHVKHLHRLARDFGIKPPT